MFNMNLLDENNEEITIKAKIDYDNGVINIYDSKNRLFTASLFLNSYLNNVDVMFKNQCDIITVYLTKKDYDNECNGLELNYSLDYLNKKEMRYNKMLKYVNKHDCKKIISYIDNIQIMKQELIDNCPKLNTKYHVHTITVHNGYKVNCSKCNQTWHCLFCNYYKTSIKHKCAYCKHLIKNENIQS